jgi:predicted TIM-barrel enzyme
MSGQPEDVAREAMRLAQHKLPIATRFVTRAETDAVAAAEAGLDRVVAASGEAEPQEVETPNGA